DLFFTFGDVALQEATVGVSRPTGTDDDSVGPWVRALNPLLLPQLMGQRYFDPDWQRLFGFNFFQIERGLEAGEPAMAMLVLQGELDAQAIDFALHASGFRPIDDPSAKVYSLFADGEIELKSDVSKIALARMNNIALYGDDILLAAPTLDLLKGMIA